MLLHNVHYHPTQVCLLCVFPPKNVSSLVAHIQKEHQAQGRIKQCRYLWNEWVNECGSLDHIHGVPSVVPGPSTSASPRNLLEIQILWPHPSLTAQNLGVKPRNLSFNKLSRDDWCTLRSIGWYKYSHRVDEKMWEHGRWPGSPMIKVRSGLCPALGDGWEPRVWLSWEVAPREALPASNGFLIPLPTPHTLQLV